MTSATRKKSPSGAGGCWNPASAAPTTSPFPPLKNFSLPGDVSASKRYWKEDIIDPEVQVSPQGMIAISDEAGTGYRIKEDLIETLTVRKEMIRA